MKLNRKQFLKSVGFMAGVSTIGSVSAQEEKHSNLDPERYGVLSDLTLCIGCRKCEYACAVNHALPHESIEKYDNPGVLQDFRRPSATEHTVVNRYPDKGINNMPLDVKVQCMHCEHPACASACIVGALQKNDMGPVTYDPDKCIGCRYCMVACPFQIPQYQYEDAFTPMVMKCDLCYEQNIKEGKRPACTEICPREVMLFGKRTELIKIAKERIRTHPDRYIDHVYGEYEVGGTSWLYISNQPFKEIGLPEMPMDCPAHLTESIQHGVFKGFSGPVLAFGLLGLAYKLFRKGEE